jgi:hypothetical protein
MGSAKSSRPEFIAAWKACDGEAAKVAEMLNTSVPRVYNRRARIEADMGIHLPSAGANGNLGRGDAGHNPNDYLQRTTIDGFSGSVIVSSDHHYWPGQGATLAHRALVEVTKEIRPKISILNGDVFDGARLSRFPRNGWEWQPKVKDELDEAKERTAEIRHAYRGARTIRTIGNHCIRFDRYLAMHASELEQVAGARLKDHLPVWEECLSVFINGNTMVKHRFHGGIHAAYNNTLRAGTNIVTGHTHHLEVKPWGDYRGRRYGVQTGCIADVGGPQFGYTEDAPTPWCSGFAVLTFDPSGRLLMPELAEVIDGKCWFRGQVVVSESKKARKNGLVPA